MANATPAVNPYAKPNAAVADSAEAYQEVKLFATSGRIGRVRYIAYGVGIYLLFGILGALISLAIGGAGMAIGWVAMLVVGFMLTIQRCHDFNTTGWLSLLLLVPLVNLIFWFIPGTDGANDYGAKTPPNGTGVIIAALIIPILFVVGVIAAVALPAYQDYTKRAQQKMMQQQPQR
jgi:uncharacterized membrane protein YhaH (DUF805 family)